MLLLKLVCHCWAVESFHSGLWAIHRLRQNHINKCPSKVPVFCFIFYCLIFVSSFVHDHESPSAFVHSPLNQPMQRSRQRNSYTTQSESEQDFGPIFSLMFRQKPPQERSNPVSCSTLRVATYYRAFSLREHSSPCSVRCLVRGKVRWCVFSTELE